MTQEEYEQAHAGLRSIPERHFIIDRRTHYSLGQLEQAREKAGLVKIEDAPVRVVHKPKAPVQTSAKEPEAVTTPVPSGAKKRLDGKPSASDTPNAPAPPAVVPEGTTIPNVIPEGIEIPENIRAMRFNDMKKLASDLGIKPVPNNTDGLVAAIEAVRSAAAGE